MIQYIAYFRVSTRKQGESGLGLVAQQSAVRKFLQPGDAIVKELTLVNFRSKLQGEVYLVFEYELPREKGRRPDVLLLSGRNLLVLEFKGF